TTTETPRSEALSAGLGEEASSRISPVYSWRTEKPVKDWCLLCAKRYHSDNCPIQRLSPDACCRAPSLALAAASFHLTAGGLVPGAGPGPPPQLSAPGRARPRRHWACSEAAAGAGWRCRRSHSAAGGRRERGCSWSSSARSWSCRSFPPRHPPRAPQPERAREPRRRRASTRAGRASSGARSPARGSPRGGASPAGTRAARWHCRDTSRVARMDAQGATPRPHCGGAERVVAPLG
ncbi:hypothetical protein MC885_002930, partial [Smutsia gigantea]